MLIANGVNISVNNILFKYKVHRDTTDTGTSYIQYITNIADHCMVTDSADNIECGQICQKGKMMLFHTVS